MIGLTYTMDTGVDSKTITTNRPMVSVRQVDCYYNRGTCSTDPTQPPEIAQNEAHTYGELTQGLKSCPYATDEDIFHASQDCQYCYSNRSQEFAYRFPEYNPKDRRRAYPYQTQRLFKVSPGPCYRSSPREVMFTMLPLIMDPHRMWYFAFQKERMTNLFPLPGQIPRMTRRLTPTLAIERSRLPPQ